jgi:hypothetical protein
MAEIVGVVAPSGFGKSTSAGNINENGIQIMGLPPTNTFYVNVKDKPMPYRGWMAKYQPIPDPLTSGQPPHIGNYLGLETIPSLSKVSTMVQVLQYVSLYRPEIRFVVLDDYQYIMGDEFMEHALKSGFEKFNKLAKNAYDAIVSCSKMRPDITCFILTHPEIDAKGNYKMKTIGTMLDNKITLEGLFTVILYGKQGYDMEAKKPTKQFVTNFDGEYPAKSPIGMFNDLYIPNDLGLVAQTIDRYNRGE